MKVKKIIIKETKNIEEYIKITKSESNQNLYSYIKIAQGCNDRYKHTFNGYNFINWLSSAGIPKKYIKIVENELV